MQALVRQETLSDLGREQMKVLADLEVTAKSVERTAEGIGAEIAWREQGKILQALPWEPPGATAEPIPILCVIEAGCKTVVASRLKRSGMFWTVRGANAILALRCSYLNGRFEDYWEDRQTALAS